MNIVKLKRFFILSSFRKYDSSEYISDKVHRGLKFGDIEFIGYTKSKKMAYNN